MAIECAAHSTRQITFSQVAFDQTNSWKNIENAEPKQASAYLPKLAICGNSLMANDSSEF